MAKEVIAHIKLQIPAGQANPAPPVGTALGPRGVNIMAFCKEFNAATQKQAGDILPVVITVFKDKSFTFITKSPPAAVLLKKAANIAAGSKEPNKTKVGKVTRKQVMDIVKNGARGRRLGVLIEQPPRLVAIDTASWARLSYDIQASDAKRILRLFDSGRIAPFLTEFHVEELVRHEDDSIFRRRVELIRSLPFIAFS